MKAFGKVLILIVAVLIAAVVSFFYFNRPAVLTQSFVEQPKEVSGSIEADETDLNVKIPGKVVKVSFEEGQEVEAGQVMAEMQADDIVAKKLRAEAALAAANAQYNKAKRGARPQQLAQAGEMMEQAKVAYHLSQSNYDRYNQLYREGVLPEQKLDMARTDLQVSLSRYQTAKEQYNLVHEGTQREDIEAAAALVAQAQAACEEVQTYLDDARVTAPITGIVTMKSIEAGELVSTGMPIATITNLRSIWLTVKIRETAIQQFQLNQMIPVRVLGVPGRAYQGKITYIGAKPGYATERATQEKGEKDLVSFEVRIKLDNSDSKLRPGMTGIINIQ